ncbi:MAG: hypothetical protein RMJ59_07175 [Candidatus Nitrosocaldus sp.]|nr:hypothetical protein [Candidatus Nitrosocaldus sp.]MDW8276140.1 hypothetical protein [Candidatus Nitrosocaldus sp.]
MSEAERAGRSIFDIYRESVTNIINEFDKVRPAYVQSITNLQQQAMDSMRKLTELALSAQREFIEPIRLPAMPDAWVRGTDEFNDALAKTTSIANRAMIAGIDTATQNIKIATDAFETFARINQNILKSIRSTLTPTKGE